MTDIEDPLFVQEEIPIRNTAIRNFGVESVTAQTFESDDGIRSSQGFKSHFLLYDSSGRRTRHEKYNRKGKMIYEWIYDEKGRLRREIAYEDSGKTNYMIESIYNHHDDWKEKRMSMSGGSIRHRIVPNRDVKGRLAEGVYYDSSDQRIRTDSHIYDGRGRLVKIDMGHMGEWIYEYDENDNLKRKTGNLPSASVLGESFEFHYDDRGLLVQIHHLHYDIAVLDYSLAI